MASRAVTAARKQALLDDLRESCRTGELVPGDQLPSMREFAAKYELSHRTIILTLQQLVEDGTLKSVPRVGMVVARPVEARLDVVYLVVVPDPGANLTSVAAGPLVTPSFEARIAQLGGRTARLQIDDAIRTVQELGPRGVGGLFLPWWPDDRQGALLAGLDVPIVAVRSVGRPEVAGGSIDVMAFDSIAGGRMAVRVLLDHGNSKIGFAGLHHEGELEEGPFPWSLERHDGWQQEIDHQGVEPGAVVLPARSATTWDRRLGSVAYRAVSALCAGQYDALVCANDRVAVQVVAELRDKAVPVAAWPPMIGFDSTESDGPYLITSLRRPWEHLARAAADVVWKRRDGRLESGLHLVNMELTQRLSAEPGWALSAPGAAALGTG